MICPKCGSRDTESTSNLETEKLRAICYRCFHEWEQKYECGSRSLDLVGTNTLWALPRL